MKKNSYLLGILGGLIGGFIACIPWILVYIYGEMILSALAIIIALGVLKGYQLFKGKIDNKLPIIIVIISCVCVTISTILIIPCLLLSTENILVNFDNLSKVYSSTPFMSAMIKDYIISLVFTFLGIAGVVKNVKKQIEEGKTENIKIEFNNLSSEELKKENEKIKKQFLKLNATDKYSAVKKDQINSDAKYFNNLKRAGIIKKYKNKYYYSQNDEKRPFVRFLKIYFKAMLIILIIFIPIFMLLILFSK